MDGGEIAMPKPADFDKLTPSEKLEARLQAWQNPEGVQFATKEAEQAYKKRVQMLIDVIKLKKPARVPVSILSPTPVTAAKIQCTITRNSATP
jgi:hypothetical protein